MDDDFINEFVKKQKAKADAEQAANEERLRLAQPLEANRRLIEEKAPQLWADLREHIEKVVLRTSEASVKAGLKPTVKFTSPRTDEVHITCGVQGVKANYNRANHKIEFATMLATAQPW